MIIKARAFWSPFLIRAASSISSCRSQQRGLHDLAKVNFDDRIRILTSHMRTKNLTCTAVIRKIPFPGKARAVDIIPIMWRAFRPLLHRSIVASFSIGCYKGFAVQTAVTDSKLEREALEELIGAQALSADLKPAIVACLSGAESRRWTIAELSGRLNNLGVHCSKPAVSGALGELALEISLCPFLPWSAGRTRNRVEPHAKERSSRTPFRSPQATRHFLGHSDRRAQGRPFGRDRLSAQGRGFKDSDW